MWLCSIFAVLSLLTIGFVIQGCGVKGDPLPPERPVEMGRGKPTYKRAFRNLQIEDEGGRLNTDGSTEEEANKRKKKNYE